VLPLDRTVADLVALSAAGVAVLSLLVAAVAVIRVGRLRRALLSAGGGTAPRAELPVADGGDTHALRHVSVVRYDAFQDMGGRMSFSAALLDDAGDGIVLTAINGRSETRSYAKGVSAGTSDIALSPEEQQAIDAALRSRRAGAAVPARRAG